MFDYDNILKLSKDELYFLLFKDYTYPYSQVNVPIIFLIRRYYLGFTQNI